MSLVSQYRNSKILPYYNYLIYAVENTITRRRKGMVIVLCVCVSVHKKLKKTTNIDGSNELLADFKLYKDQ